MYFPNFYPTRKPADFAAYLAHLAGLADLRRQLQMRDCAR